MFSSSESFWTQCDNCQTFEVNTKEVILKAGRAVWLIKSFQNRRLVLSSFESFARSALVAGDWCTKRSRLFSTTQQAKDFGQSPGGGGHLYFRLDIILVPRKRTFKTHPINMYFPGMKIDPIKYAFLHAFFVMSFPKFVTMTKHTRPFFFPILHVFACTPKRCKRVHCLVLKNNSNYVNIFYEDDTQLQIKVAPPVVKVTYFHSTLGISSAQNGPGKLALPPTQTIQNIWIYN